MSIEVAKLNVREAIRQRLGGMSDLERRIADFTLANYRDCAMLNIGELAEACDVSNTTVNRYTRNLGYEGYHEYRRTLRDEVAQNSSLSLLKEMMRGGDTFAILSTSLDEDAELINRLREGLDSTLFSDVVERICSARRVFVLGQGTSAYLAQYLTFNLLGVGIDAQDFGDAGGVEGAARRALQVGKDDLLIAIAFPRFSQLTADLLGLAKEVGCYRISITSSLSSPIARASDGVLLAPARRDLHSGSAVPAMAVLEALITAVTARAESAEQAASVLAPLIDHQLLS